MDFIEKITLIWLTVVLGSMYCFFKRKTVMTFDPVQAKQHARKAFFAIQLTSDEVGLERFLDTTMKIIRYIVRSALQCVTFEDAINVFLRFNSADEFRKECASNILSQEETQTVDKLFENLQGYAAPKKFY